MTRSEARRKIRPAALRQMMRGVIFDRGRLEDLVEEAPAAYREIKEVLEDQADLVAPVLRLEPIAVLKG
jgi:tRNA-splicing ligase RtcB